ncbi:MAG: hypothetical protein ACKOA0_08435, partial [Burkholderiaceae bacterium]
MISTRAGMVGPDSLALATVRIRYDANANGRFESVELQSPFTATTITAHSFSATRGQFSLPTALTNFNPADGVLEFTSTGGTVIGINTEIPVSGPVQYSSILAHPVINSDNTFQIVLSPITTLATHRFQQQLQAGSPAGINLPQAYADQLAYVASTLGVDSSATSLMSVAPERDVAKRLVTEWQMNALLNILVSMTTARDSAPTDTVSIDLSASTSAAISQRLAQFITSHGSFDPTDAVQLKLAMASVLPASFVIDDTLSAALARLMTTYALGLDGQLNLARAAHGLIPDLARISAGLNAAMVNGTLNSAELQTNLKVGLDRFIADLESVLTDLRTDNDVFVIVDETGAWIDRNLDGKIDAKDKVNNALVAADFGAGKNADPATHHLNIRLHALPSIALSQSLATLGSDDRANFDFDTRYSGTPLDFKWSAADANLALTQKNIQLTARGIGSSATLSIGKLPAISNTQGVTTPLGALILIASGDANKFVFSQAKMTIGLGSNTSGTAQGGVIHGPIHVQGAGQFASAHLIAASNAGLQATDINVVATGSQSKASSLLQAAGSGARSANRIAAAGYGERGVSEIKLVSAAGHIQIGSQISALSSGDGATSL